MKSFAAALLTTFAMATPLAAGEMNFIRWIAKWSTSYKTTEEYQTRLENWLKADAFIREVNDPNSAW